MMYNQKSKGVRRYRALALIPALALAATIGRMPAVASVFNSIDAVSVDLIDSHSDVAIASETTNEAATDSEVTEKPATTQKIAEFPGGVAAMYKFLADNIKYPESAKNKKVEGKVVVRLTISEKGKIGDIEIVKSVDPELDNEAIKVVKSMPDWNPAVSDGKAVASQYVIPIVFKLN